MKIGTVTKVALVVVSGLTVGVAAFLARYSAGKGTCPRCGDYAELHACRNCDYALCSTCWDQVYNVCPSCGTHH